MANIITTAALLDDSVIALMDAAFLLAAQDNIVIDLFVDIKRDINAKTIDIPKYPKLAKNVTPLIDGEDVYSVGLSDTKVPLTPLEYGNVVTVTTLANLQTGGKADLASAAVVAMNMVETLNRLGCMALQASGNVRLANELDDLANIDDADIIKDADLEYVYNRLHRQNIPPFEGGLYIAIAHPDVIDDLKTEANTKWVEVSKYADAMSILRHEMGMYKGFRWIATAGMEPEAKDSGELGEDNPVDIYRTAFLGRNALGKAVSLEPGLTITGPFDKLGRMLHIGWYGVLKYGIVDQDSLWVITSASTFGDNEATTPE